MSTRNGGVIAPRPALPHTVGGVLPEALQGEVAQLMRRYGPTLVRTVDLDLRGFDSPRFGSNVPTTPASLAASLADPSKRAAEVCLVIRRPNGKVLVDYSAYYPGSVSRLFTGGIKPGESILAAAQREALEETGLQTEVRRFLAALSYRTNHIVALGCADPIFHTFALLLDEVGGTLGTLDPAERFDELREVTPTELAALTAELERVDQLDPKEIGAPALAYAASKGIDPRTGLDWLRYRIPAHRAVVEALGAA